MPRLTPSPDGSADPFHVTRPPEPRGVRGEPASSRAVSLPFTMDDGAVRVVELPAALQQLSGFTSGELARLTRVYAEAQALLEPHR
jgi:hypothetical protein